MLFWYIVLDLIDSFFFKQVVHVMDKLVEEDFWRQVSSNWIEFQSFL